jgi:hypothetical protein
MTSSLDRAREYHRLAEANISRRGGSVSGAQLTVTGHVLAAWDELAPLPTGPLSSFGTVALNGKITIFGGISDVGDPNTLHEYDPVNDSWRTKADMLAPRFAMGAATLGGKIYVVGMTDGAAVHAYDPATDTWRRRARLPGPRAGLECVTVGGKLYAIGGGSFGEPGPVDEYDPASNTWTTRKSAPPPYMDSEPRPLTGG